MKRKVKTLLSYSLRHFPPNKECHKMLYGVPMSVTNGMESGGTKVFGVGMLQTGLGIVEQWDNYRTETSMHSTPTTLDFKSPVTASFIGLIICFYVKWEAKYSS